MAGGKVLAENQYAVAQWVGFDRRESDSTTAILQAGTETVLETAQGVAGWPGYPGLFGATYAIWEWWPAEPLIIQNFPVAFGDNIHCSISYAPIPPPPPPLPPPPARFISLINTSSLASVGFYVTAEPSTPLALVGDTAEWIVERPWNPSARVTYLWWTTDGSTWPGVSQCNPARQVNRHGLRIYRKLASWTCITTVVIVGSRFRESAIASS
jgi:hypothetical protein